MPLEPVAPAEVNLHHNLWIQLGKVILGRNPEVDCIGIKIVQIQEHAAPGLNMKSIEKSWLAHIWVRNGRENGAVLEQDPGSERVAELPHLATDETQCFL